MSCFVLPQHRCSSILMAVSFKECLLVDTLPILEFQCKLLLLLPGALLVIINPSLPKILPKHFEPILQHLSHFTLYQKYLYVSLCHQTGNLLKAGTVSYLHLHHPPILAKSFVHSEYFINICEQTSHENQSRLTYNMSQLFRKC